MPEFSATILTLFVIPVAYAIVARWTGSPEARVRQLEELSRTEKQF